MVILNGQVKFSQVHEFFSSPSTTL